MAVRHIDDQDLIFRIALGGRDPAGFLNALSGHILPAVIQIFQFLGGIQSPVLILFKEKSQGSFRSIQPAGGVHAGSQDKSGMIGSQDAACQAGHGDQGPESGVGRRCRCLQSVTDHDPVLILQRHDIADRSQGTESQQFSQKFLSSRRIHPGSQDLSQLPGNGSPADIAEGVVRSSGHRGRNLGIHDRVSGRQDPGLFPVLFQMERHLMMICHDHGHTGLFGGPQGPRSRYAVITGQDRINPAVSCLPDQTFIDSVSVADPVGKPGIRRGPAGPQYRDQYVGGTDPVHIIVPDDTDGFPLADPILQQADGPVHIRQEIRIMQHVHGPVQVAPGRFHPDHIPVADDPCQNRRYAAGPGDPHEIFFFMIYHPLGHGFPPEKTGGYLSIPLLFVTVCDQTTVLDLFLSSISFCFCSLLSFLDILPWPLYLLWLTTGPLPLGASAA